LPVTWLLLHTSVTANQITIVSLAIAMIAMLFLAIPGIAAFFAGVLFLQLWYYLDHVDGQIARYRKTASLTGRFLDFLTHHIVHTALFLSFGFYGYAASGAVLFIIWGCIAALAMASFNVMHDVKYKTFFEKLSLEGGTIQPLAAGSANSAPLKSIPRRCFSLVHKACEIHVMINVLSLAAIVQIFISKVDFRFILFMLYGAIAPFITVTKLAYILKHQKVDQEYRDLFKS